MNWTTLLLLAGPLMMLFCMKGMFSGSKDTKRSQTGPTELESLQIKMADLIEQNHKLTQEIENIKNSNVEGTNAIN